MAHTVSVVCSTFGDRRWVELAEDRAWPSVIAQTAPAHELIHEHAGTLHEARNAGADRATGDWLCFLDADDELDRRYLEAMQQAIPHGELLQPATTYIGPEGATPPECIEARPLLEGNYLVIGTLVPKVVFDRVGGFAPWPLYEDWDLWIRCARAGARIVQVPRAIYRAYVRTGSRNRPSRATQRRYFEAIRRQYA